MTGTYVRDQQLFSLLDRDEDGFIDFRAILVFLFSTEVSLSPEEARLRSFRFYDRSDLESFNLTLKSYQNNLINQEMI